MAGLAILGAVVVAVLLLSAVVSIFIWLVKKGIGCIASAVILAICGVLGLAAHYGSNLPSQPAAMIEPTGEEATPVAIPTRTAAATAPTSSTATPTALCTITPEAVSNIDFFDIRKQMDGLTPLEREYLSAALRGCRVRWTGWVKKIENTGLIWIEMDSPGDGNGDGDVPLQLTEAQGCSQGQNVSFVGTIRDMTGQGDSFTVTLERATLVR